MRTRSRRPDRHRSGHRDRYRHPWLDGKSLDTKREANARVEVVTAEDVGKLPAHNVADTLQRLPGVNISSSSADEGGFDEADRVSLRGTSPSLTQTLINATASARPTGSCSAKVAMSAAASATPCCRRNWCARWR